MKSLSRQSLRVTEVHGPLGVTDNHEMTQWANTWSDRRS